jgi:nucleotide-binding universal stress UspA family protein
MKRQILVPLDGSPEAEVILPHAKEMARLTSSELALLQAVPMPFLVTPMVGTAAPSINTWGIWEDDLDDARAYLAATAKRLQSEGHTVVTEVVDTSPEAAIVSYASKPSVIMIAMVTHGRSGLSRWVFGSVAEKVLQAAPKPLLLVRPTGKKDSAQAASIAEYHTIVVPLDGSSFAEQSLGWAQALATRTGATLELVSVVSLPANRTPAGPRGDPVVAWGPVALVPTPHAPAPFADGLSPDSELAKRRTTTAGDVQQEDIDRITDYLQKVAQPLRAEGMNVQTKVVHGHAAEMIMQSSNKEHADLIVMSTHGRGGLQRLWLGGVAVKVVRGSATPVLLVRAREHEE